MRLRFSTNTEMVQIPDDTLAYVEADGNYSTLHMADGSQYVLTLQLGQVEKRLADLLNQHDTRFIRIGKSLIINQAYLSFINYTRQRMILSDCRTFRHELSASKEALKALKDYIEKEVIK